VKQPKHAVTRNSATPTNIDELRDLGGEDPTDESPITLYDAISRDDYDLAQSLLSSGANPNLRDHGEGRMPLHKAAEAGQEKLVRLLIEHGADVSATSKSNILRSLYVLVSQVAQRGF